jgi:NAD(P)-dependent dehydrogenase (short-subunit alcohol dehydrogenase family)
MTVTLITGANKGLGYETARSLVAAGHTVYVGARDPERGQEAADDLAASFLQIDVTDEDSVNSAAAELKTREGRLDVLVNNAGIAGTRLPAAETTAADLLAVYQTNVFGIVRVIHAFLPLLEVSDRPVVVNVGSGLGSLAVTTDPERIEYNITGLAYPSSKSAVVMLTSQYAKSLPHIKFNVVDPGYTSTDLNQNRGTQTIEEGARSIVRMALTGADGPTGTFTDNNETVPW